MTYIKKRAPTVHPFLDVVKNALGIHYDRHLSTYLGYHEYMVTFIRGGFRRVTDEVLLAAHEATDIPIATLRSLIPADQQPKPFGLRARGEP